MTIQPTQANLINNPAILTPRGWDWRLALWIKQIISPPVTTMAAFVLIGVILATPAGWLWMLYLSLLTVVVPSLYVLALYEYGVVSDIHLRNRAERFRPTLVTLGATFVGWVTLVAAHGPPLLTALAGANLLQTTLFFLITQRWKISAHSAAAAMLAVLASWGLTGVAALPVILSVPVVAWSRVRLKDHTPAQTAVGAILSSLIFAAALLLVKPH